MPEFSPETVAFVTGAASGIGLAVAQQLIKDGVQNIALVDLSLSRLTTAAQVLRDTNPSVKFHLANADCSSEEAVDKAVTETVAAFGRVDVAFNGAGIAMNTDAIENLEVSSLDRLLDVNLRGVWLCERAIIRQMMKQEEHPVSTGLPLKTRGSIVNAGSIASHLGLKSLGPYVIAKHGVMGLTKTDASDYGEANIRINCVCPGWIKTAMTKGLSDTKFGEVLAGRAPVKRWGLPEEVAYTVSFLLSDKASFITGASISVDGGYTAS